jgi:hypothetical protein
VRAVWVLCLAVAACGPTPAEPLTGRARSAIVGGTPAPDDDAVFALGTPGGGMFCTATLIGERTLLTAAHCVDGSAALQASPRADVKSWPADAFDVAERRLHPRWNGQDFDVALLLLAAPPGVAPAAWNRQPVRQSTVPMVRAVGFGDTKADGQGVRYQADVPVTAVNDSILFIGTGSTPTTCFGDSGGPSFYTGSDGIERIVGVHAFATSTECTGGGDSRVDTVADFIDGWTREKAPTCATDAACVMGCPQEDLDCYCTTDGACDARCPLPDTDADCPRHCLADGVCAYGACGMPDPDCLGDGESCTSAELCSGHQCLSDAQRDQPYCSRTCTSSSECNADMRCSFSVCRYPVLPVVGMGDPCSLGATVCSGGVCGGQSLDTTVCRLSCGSGDSCPGSMRCVGGVGGVRYCQAPVTLQHLAQEQPAHRRGCSASGGEAFCLAAAALALALSRRARR